MDGNKLNNRADNLEYVTCSQNHRHGYRLGLSSAKGNDNSRAKLTAEIVLDLREQALHADRGFFSAKARELGVSKSTILEAVRGRSWNYLPPLLPWTDMDYRDTMDNDQKAW